LRACRTTRSETTPVPPRITIFDGLRRASSVAVGPGRESRAVSRMGPFALAAAGDPASASGKEAPVARKTVEAPPPKRALLMAAAVA
jgi:hypothetical protein